LAPIIHQRASSVRFDTHHAFDPAFKGAIKKNKDGVGARSVHDVVRGEDEDLADHVRVLLVSGHEADDPAAGGLFDHVLEAFAHDVLEGHALADDVVVVSARGNATLVVPQGELDIATTPDLEAVLTAQSGRVVVDLRESPSPTRPPYTR
jgi:hypothetical protein